ncbi:sphingoid long-chain bases kinase 1-like [Zingiber officinale]|uniref:DAGKc domain-containing protein n=1 Tax=Zingiber officinale TaxID=94328 RepID=A0A8J5C413_ZINOF|nr:sphingoid long-chain bases kinase 1-like [Zingiber officinale]XP_042447544.1 sphingoid long-chain bases kinase 1-like [Zingiber officinale]XP_042447545.1 sphingoid long-chain bases kinase 1-like [Zingiber officinale]KAG6470563.1 hypothetical protein ZIOFF_071637 [Zingiber officinale]
MSKFENLPFLKKEAKVKSLQQTDAHVTSDHPLKLKEHRLDIGDENYDLLGYEVYSGKLVLDNKNKGTTTDEQIGSRIGNSDSIDAKLSSKALAWGSHVLHVGDVISLVGFEMEVVKTEYAGHARELASTIEINTYPNGIVCVGGDGIVNEVLNGLLSRDKQKDALSIPIGIIPADLEKFTILDYFGG